MSTEERPFRDSLFNLAGSQATPAGYREVNAIVGENRMNLVRHGRDEVAKEVGGDPCGCFLMQLGKGEFRRSVDSDEEMELAFLGPHFGNVDMEEADRVSLELLPRRLVPLDIWQLADAMTLEATMQRGACQMRDGRLQCIEAIIERQERMPPEGDNDRLNGRRRAREKPGREDRGTPPKTGALRGDAGES